MNAVLESSYGFLDKYDDDDEDDDDDDDETSAEWGVPNAKVGEAGREGVSGAELGSQCHGS